VDIPKNLCLEAGVELYTDPKENSKDRDTKRKAACWVPSYSLNLSSLASFRLHLQALLPRRPFIVYREEFLI
jgi:hypothetical protein